MVGSDLQSLSELRQRPGLFASRAVFTRYERDYCEGRRDAWASFGGLLCAKEACVKMLSAFESAPRISFLDLEIHHSASGRPSLRPGARLGAWLDGLGLRVDLSISHSGDYAMATAIAVVSVPSMAVAHG